MRVTGVGRNEYISIMNACKAKKLMWRVNKGIAKDLLPAVPLDIKMEGWWIVNVVNVGTWGMGVLMQTNDLCRFVTYMSVVCIWLQQAVGQVCSFLREDGYIVDTFAVSDSAL